MIDDVERANEELSKLQIAAVAALAKLLMHDDPRIRIEAARAILEYQPDYEESEEPEVSLN